jgi:CheY-like chemotaxis protein
MSTSSDSKKTVVVADHRGPERTVLEAVLKRLGYGVIPVESTEELDAKLKSGATVDLVVLGSELAGESPDDLARRIGRPDRRVILVDAQDRGDGQMVGFIDLTEDAYLGIGIRVPEIVFLANDLLFSRAGIPRRKRRIYGGFPTSYEVDGERVQGSLYNLSAEGAFIETVTPPATEKMVQVDFDLPKVGAFSFKARVTWRVQSHETEGRRSPPGMGVQFVDVDPAETEKVQMFVSSGGHV